MMKSLQLLIFLTAFNFINAQVTITKSFNDPSAGDIVNNYNVIGTVDNTSSGNNVTFDNASLSQGSLSVSSYTVPAASDVAAFPGSTLKMTDDTSTILYKTSSTKLEITGLTSSGATLNFSADNGTVITYPASFGYAETDNARGTFSSSSGSGLFKGTINNSADAAGTLIIGTKIYSNVLRIKSIQNFNLYQSTDTNYLFSIGTITNTTYVYYDSIHKFPLLSTSNGNLSIPLLSINQNTSKAQALEDVFLSVDDAGYKKITFIAPNPVQDRLKIYGDDAQQLIIYDLEGRMLLKKEISDEIDVSALKKGLYMLQITNLNQETIRLKFIKN
jgi:Secretion system C-terminal sorting domain